MHVIICGGRNHPSFGYKEYEYLDQLLSTHTISEVITGGATGADTWADYWAASRQVERVVFFPSWIKHGKAAGPLRNEKMLRYLVQCLDEKGLIAFPGGRGTAHMVSLARNISAKIFLFPSLEAQ